MKFTSSSTANLQREQGLSSMSGQAGNQPCNPIIEVRDLVTRFGDHVVLNNLDLDVHRGEVLGVVGGSGAGKSVLLHTIVGLLKPAAGSIQVLGCEMMRASDDARREIEQRWGVMFQDGALFSSLTVRQNIEVPMREQLNLDADTRRSLADLKLSLVGLPASAASKYPSELSGGMRKRAGLARALALDPEIVFLDEPTAGLDPIGAAAFDTLIQKLQKALGLTVFFVTHDLDSLHTICDRVAVLVGGEMYATGTLQEVREVKHPWIHQYFHGPRARAVRNLTVEAQY